MDASRDRPGAVDRRRGRADRADAGRRHRRCGPFGAAGGGPGGCDHRHERAGLCAVADLPGGGDRGDAACGRKLRARPGDRRDQPRAGRTAGDGRAARAQCPLCLARQRNGRGRDGHGRLSAVEPFGVSRHLHPGVSDLAGAFAHPRARDRRGPGARRGAAGGARCPRDERVQSGASAPLADFRRPPCCCCNSPMRRCCR